MFAQQYPQTPPRKKKSQGPLRTKALRLALCSQLHLGAMAAKGSQVKLFTGNANPELAHAIAELLGIPISKAKVGKFSNGETMVEIEVRDPLCPRLR